MTNPPDAETREREDELRSYLWRVLSMSGVHQYDSDYDDLLDAYRAAVRAATIAEVRGVVEGVPTHFDSLGVLQDRTAIAFATDLLRSLDRLNGEGT